MSALSFLLDISTQTSKAFDFALEISKQLITLAIGIIAISITFTKDILSTIPQKHSKLLSSSWLLFFLSVLLGILHMMALTGSLAPMEITTYAQQKKTEILVSGSARFFALTQIITFIFGVFFIVLYGIKSLTSNSVKNQKKVNA